MANFAPKKDPSSAKGSLARDNTEHQEPPTIHLGHEHLKALGLHKGPMPKVGSKIKITGLVHVGAHSEGTEHAPSGGKAPGGEGNTHRTMTLHLHKMDMATGKQGSEEADEDQKAGMKGEIDKALAREAGGKKSNDDEGAEGKTRTPRGNNGPTG